ncbi:DUF6252 family protein [uncultured Christiangramia sp.]|uniref:DUF6252 family protein n=1 Tax=uncultured Christiangramia sp. TaxID=503836 RepID=UPI00262058FC|nr:DUF6252 family protein [uncultured Christiangramia sp.]
MKNFIQVLILCVTISFVISSCQKDDALEESDFISASINDENWNGTPEIYIDTANDSLTILGYGNEQHIFIKTKFKGEGTYNLENSRTNYYTTIGGDVITSNYIFDANSTSQLKITDYDSELNIIKGEFEVSLLKEWSNPENDIDKTIFKNGKFRGTIRD